MGKGNSKLRMGLFWNRLTEATLSGSWYWSPPGFINTLCTVCMANILIAIPARHVRLHRKCHRDVPGLAGLELAGEGSYDLLF